MLLGARGLLQVLAREAHVGEHTQVELRIGRGVATNRIVPDGEVGHLSRVIDAIEEADLVDRGLVGLVVVAVVVGIDAVAHGLQVLRDEYTVALRAGDLRGFVLEHRRVVVAGCLDRVGLEEIDKRAAQRVGLLAILRIARHNERVDRRARREDVAQATQGVTLVIIGHGRAELDGVGGVLVERVGLNLHRYATASERDGRLLAHCRRGVDLLLLILQLDILVEGEIDPVATKVGRIKLGRNGHNNRRQRVARTARRGADRGTL